jgi:hypothetical protein
MGAAAGRDAASPRLPRELRSHACEQWDGTGGVRVAAPPTLARRVVHVTGGNGHARRFLDRDVTFNLRTCHLTTPDVDGDGMRDVTDVLPGVGVRVKARMSRRLGRVVPDLITALSATASPPGV